MSTAGIAAAAAYRAAAGAVPAAGATTGATEGGGFGGMLRRALEQGVEIGRSAEAASTAAMLGQGGVTEAVLAISRAELALQTTVAVRDRVVSAYQDVMRMPI
jgi:flagellar hook-basal body complex protein FliE